jgi:hypothetical protein
MDQYMRDNKVEGVPSKISKAAPPVEEIIDDSKSDKAAEDTPKTKGKAKSADKAH